MVLVWKAITRATFFNVGNQSVESVNLCYWISNDFVAALKLFWSVAGPKLRPPSASMNCVFSTKRQQNQLPLLFANVVHPLYTIHNGIRHSTRYRIVLHLLYSINMNGHRLAALLSAYYTASNPSKCLFWRISVTAEWICSDSVTFRTLHNNIYPGFQWLNVTVTRSFDSAIEWNFRLDITTK